ncbi:MAG: sulfatase-like hydrolase/transferase, partial [Gammaproteobacteria bacterium]|nr:sulfatase-like hydrolase/transferase [Gammaproteobacteria bacterium]
MTIHTPRSTQLLWSWARDLHLILFFILFLQLFRLLLITTFSAQAAAITAGDLGRVLLTGLRFDISTATLWALLPILGGFYLLVQPQSRINETLRRFSGRLFLLISIPLAAADLIYFDEYGDQFDNRIFGIIHDDTTAILITLWKSYHPVLSLVFTLLLIALGWRLCHWWLAWQWTPLSQWLRQRSTVTASLLATGLFIFFVALLRGGTLWGEPIRLKHAFVAQEMLLNRSVLNPHSALRYTIAARLSLESSTSLETFWPEGDLTTALNEVRKQRALPPITSHNLEQGLQVVAHGPKWQRARHIFLILIESHSGWTVMPRYRSLQFSPGLSELADKGIYFANFLPASSGTVGALNTLITGLPETELNLNYEPTALKPFASSLAQLLHQEGMRTRFFYGGFLSWQRLDRFAQNQGFDEIYGGGQMAVAQETNEWGVRDRQLFDFILSKLDDNQPSFNFILTTTNHPPYDLNLTAAGFPFT